MTGSTNQNVSSQPSGPIEIHQRPDDDTPILTASTP